MIYTVDILFGDGLEIVREMEFLKDPTRKQVVDRVKYDYPNFNEISDSVDYYPKVPIQASLGAVYLNSDDREALFTEKQLIDFGNYLLSPERLINLQNVPHLHAVTDSDVDNWKERNRGCFSSPPEERSYNGSMS